jgi:hypothetical protein
MDYAKAARSPRPSAILPAATTGIDLASMSFLKHLRFEELRN